jgi:small subunit ribosomal protein S13e
MGRMHSKGKGLSGSAMPYKRSAPAWLKITQAEVRGRFATRNQLCD